MSFVNQLNGTVVESDATPVSESKVKPTTSSPKNTKAVPSSSETPQKSDKGESHADPTPGAKAEDDEEMPSDEGKGASTDKTRAKSSALKKEWLIDYCLILSRLINNWNCPESKLS